jgi:DNA invertase Pin-like site-specific DNA recombinase
LSDGSIESNLTKPVREGADDARWLRQGEHRRPEHVRQLDGVEVERVFTDKASGKDTTRPKLDELIAFVRDGDTVLVHSMDRLARNLDDLRRLVRTLTGKGVRVEFVKESLDLHRRGLADGHPAAVGDGRLRGV